MGSVEQEISKVAARHNIRHRVLIVHNLSDIGENENIGQDNLSGLFPYEDGSRVVNILLVRFRETQGAGGQAALCA